MPSNASRDLAFENGELDLEYGMQDQTWVDRTRKVPHAIVDVFEPGEEAILHLNMSQKPLDDIRVRQAIAYAVNRPELLRWQGAEVSRMPGSVIPIGNLGYTADNGLPQFNLAKAKALLAEAGYPNGLTLKVIHTQLPSMLAQMQVVQAELKRAGINLDLQVVEHATFHQMIRQDLSQHRVLHGGALPGGRHLPDAVLPLAQHREDADRGDQFQPLQCRRRRDRRRPHRAGRHEADRAVARGAAQDRRPDVRGAADRDAAGLGAARRPRLRLPAERLAVARADDHGGNALQVIHFIARRLLAAIPTLLAVLTLVFVIVRIVPGDPAVGDPRRPRDAGCGGGAAGTARPRPADLAAICRLPRQSLSGDFGTSMVTNRPILADVRAVLPHTHRPDAGGDADRHGHRACPPGVWAALHRNRAIDVAARLLSLIGLSFPVFVSGMFMLLLFALHWRIFPVIGNADLSDPVDRSDQAGAARGHARAGDGGLHHAGDAQRDAAGAGEDYMRTARAKGVPWRRVVWRHGLRNAGLPVVTVVGLYVGILIGNSVLTEIVFNRPGLGKIIVGALEPARLHHAAGADGDLLLPHRRRESADRPDLWADRSAG